MTKFINIDGIDCSGKSTFSKELMVKLQSEGYKVFIQHFPRYETEIGQTIKERLYSGNLEGIQELYLDDQINFSKEVKDGLYSEYDVVILDRYFISSSVYEGTIYGPHSKERDNLLKKHLKAIHKQDLMVPTYNIIVAIFDTNHHDIIKTRLAHKKNKDSMETLEKLEIANTLYLSTYFNNCYEFDRSLFKLLPIITTDNIDNLVDKINFDIKTI